MKNAPQQPKNAKNCGFFEEKGTKAAKNVKKRGF
jgi:hypothetical protein